MSRPGIPSRPLAGPGTPRARLGFQAVDAALLGVTVIWGANSVAIKHALLQFSPLSFNVVRFLIACVLILVVLRIAEGPLRFPLKDLPVLALVGFVGNTVYQIGFIKGLSLTTAGNAAFMLATTPATTALLGHVLGFERISRRVFGGVGITLGGAVLVAASAGGSVSFGGASVRGDVITLAGTLGWCFYTLMSKGLLARYTPLGLTAWTMVLGAGPLALFGLPELVQQDWSLPGPVEWATLAGSAVLALVVCYVAWGWGVSRLGSVRTALYGNIVPLWTGLLGWLLMDETWGAVRIVGAGLILLGVAVVRAGQTVAPAPRSSGKVLRRLDSGRST